MQEPTMDRDEAEETVPIDETDGADPTAEENEKILAEARKNLYSSSSGWDWILQRMRDDIEFSSGRQWDPATEAAREGRPNLVIDKTRKFIEKIIGAYRQDPPGVKVFPHSSGNKLTACIYEDYLRRFFANSTNKGAIIRSGEHQAICGYGWMEVSYGYRGENSFELEPKLFTVDDPRSVRIDRSAVELDGEDTRWAFRLSRMDKTEAEEKYGEGVTSWDSIPQQYVDQWTDDSQVVIADYWWIKEEDDELVKIRTADGKISKMFFSELNEHGKYPEGSYQVMSRRPATRKQCHHAVLTGAGVVKSEEFPSSCIPIVPVYGRQCWQDNRSYYSGIIRPAMDAQRLINYYASTAAEATALAPRIPYVVAEGQLEGHEHEWDLMNVKNLPYLQYRMVALNGINAPPPQRTPTAADVSPLLASLQAATADLTDVVGIYEASLGQETASAKSGTAIRESSKNSDQVLAVYFDNLRRAVVRVARIVAGMLPRLVTEETILRIQAEDGKEYSVAVNSATPMPTTHPAARGQPAMIDLSEGEYEIELEAASSYSTRRQEMAHASSEMLGVLPDMQRAAIAPLVVGAQDWPGAEKMKAVLMASLPPEIAKAYADENANIPAEAKAMLDQAMQQLQQVHGEADGLVQQLKQAQDQIVQLQTAILSNDRDVDAKLQIAQMSIQAKMHEKLVDIGGESAARQANAENDMLMHALNHKADMNSRLVDHAAKAAEHFLGGSSTSHGLPGDQISGVPDKLVFPKTK